MVHPPYSQRCGTGPHPKKWKIKSYKKAVIIECNLGAFDDSIYLIQEYMKEKPKTSSDTNTSPKLVISKDIHTGLQLYETVDPVPDMELGALEEQFNVSGILGFVEISSFYFLVAIVQSCCIASFPVNYPVYAPSTNVNTISPGYVNPHRTESLVYRIDGVALIPVHLPSQFWGLSISNEHELMPSQILSEMAFDDPAQATAANRYYVASFIENELTNVLGEKVMKIRAGIAKFLSKHHYYSYDLDLTRSAQKFSIGLTGAFVAQSQPIPMIKRWVLGASPTGREERHFEQRCTGPSLIDVVDKRFCWNYMMVHSVKKTRNIDGRWFIPMIQGNVSSSLVILEKDDFTSASIISDSKRVDSKTKPYAIEIYLIARREWYRGGTRYYHRGLDKDGNVANFVESEMTMCISRACNNKPSSRMTTKELINYMRSTGDEFKLDAPGMGWSSFVQIRGSVPLFWMQNIKKNPAAPPPILLETLNPTHPKYSIHMDSLMKTYGTIYCVNLLSQTRGNEDRLTRAWLSQNKLFGTNNDVFSLNQKKKTSPSIVSWDFHKELKNSSFNEALTDFWLSDEAQSAIMRCGYFVERPLWVNKSIHQFQTGVVRTNCLDCLDRTNAMQYWFAWNWFRCYVSDRGFHTFTMDARGYKVSENSENKAVSAYYIGGIEDDITVDTYALIDPNDKSSVPSDSLTNPAREIVVNMWADHGDRISEIYTGTGSVITGLLKEGKNTINTRFNHVSKSINRLYYNAYEDHNRQEWIDNMLKQYVVDLPFHTTVEPAPLELDQLLSDLQAD